MDSEQVGFFNYQRRTIITSFLIICQIILDKHSLLIGQLQN